MDTLSANKKNKLLEKIVKFEILHDNYLEADKNAREHYGAIEIIRSNPFTEVDPTNCSVCNGINHVEEAKKWGEQANDYLNQMARMIK